MAIKIYDNFYSIIIKVDSIIRIYGENGLETFLKEFFPKPFKTKEQKKRKSFFSLFSKSSPIQDNIQKEYMIDDYSHIQCAEKFNHLTCLYGHDGNLVYMSFAKEEDMLACCERLSKQGFYGYKGVIYVEDVDYVIYEKNGFPISIQWLETIEEDRGSEYTASNYAYSISPFKQPVCPTSFPSIQGGIRYETELQWVLGQKYIQNKEFNRFSELSDVSLIYTNCNIGGHIKESVDDWFRAYDAKINLSEFSGNMEYKLISILGNCIQSCNFIPLYYFLDDKPIVRLDMKEAERPVSKYDLIIKLTKIIQKIGLLNYEIQIKKNKYVGLIKGQEIRNTIEIKVIQNKIHTLWLVNEELYILTKDNSTIINQIAKEWNQGNPLYIERYLADDFNYTLYGKREIFGYHVLNKRQYIIWWESASEIYAKAGVIYQPFFTPSGINGIICYMNKNESKMFVVLKIVDGIIVSAEEKISPL